MKVLDMARTAEIDEILRSGNILARPTDTVYGVAASLAAPGARARLFTLKQRPVTVALPVLVASVEDARGLGVTWTDEAATLADALWPGALTIIVPAPADVARMVGADDTLGVRCPGDSALRELLAVTGPLAVTSANVHGQPPCTSVADVEAAFAGSDDLAGVVDGGERTGVVSTVVDVTTRPFTIRRHGAIDQARLDELLR